MDERYLLGVDVGTSSLVGVLIDQELNVVASAAESHDISIPNPGWAEQDADAVWWTEFRQVTRRLVEQSDVPADRIAGVGVSALAPAMVPLDATGTPLRPAILYGIDTRSGREIEHLEASIGEERIYETCGNSLTFQSVGPKILWYKRNEPQKFDATETIVDVVGYVTYKLTGEYTLNNGVAGFFDPMYNPSTLDWDDELCAEVGITRDLLPDPQWATEIAGVVTDAAAEATGLAAGTPVIAGTVDGLAALLSVGAVNPGDTIAVYGTAGILYTTLSEERTARDLWAGPHCLEGMYAIGGGMATTGAITRWFANEFGDGDGTGERERYRRLDDRAAEIGPGSDGLLVLPYFSGERTPIYDDSARGTITGLTLSHTRDHVYRALLEGVGYGFRHLHDTMADADVPIERVFALGGGAKSPLWRQIVSDVTGVTQQYVSNPVGAPLGSAYLAGLGTGVFDSTEPLEAATTVESTTEPVPENQATYDEYYSIYRDLYRSTREEMHRLASLGSE